MPVNITFGRSQGIVSSPRDSSGANDPGWEAASSLTVLLASVNAAGATAPTPAFLDLVARRGPYPQVLLPPAALLLCQWLPLKRAKDAWG